MSDQVITLLQITQRHYDIITKQAADNFPRETGGYLGGKDGVVQAILPIYNLHDGNQTDTFAFSTEDTERAKLFFKKHNLTYFGLYHSHPNGIPYPSHTDIATRHKYHFIISLPDKNQSSAVFRAYYIHHRSPHPIPIKIIPNSQVQVVNIHKGETAPATPIYDRPITLQDELSQLTTQIDNILDGKPKYDRKTSKSPKKSDFSTLA